ncbi:MAG: hypothetical protein ACKOQ3_07270 [Novosphingobium sp.]
MNIGQVSAAGAALAAVMGAGYAASGSPDFSVEVHRAPDAVYSAFSAINPADTDFQAAGMPVQHITVTRTPGREIVFSAPTANDGQPLRIALTFAPGGDAASTKVTAAIDVPPVPMRVDGTDKYLSEAKVEAKLRDAIGDMAKRIDDGNSTTVASYKLATMLQMVAVAAQPAKLKAVVERSEAEQAAARVTRKRMERDGWKFRGDGSASRMERVDAEYADPRPKEIDNRDNLRSDETGY